GRDNRPAQGLVDAHVDDSFQAFAADVAHVFGDAITNDGGIVDREFYNREKSCYDREVEIVMGPHPRATRHNAIQNYRDGRSYTKPKLEPEPDVNSHHDCSSNHRPSPALAEFLADLRSDRLNPPDFKPVRTKLFREARAKLLAKGTDLNRRFFQPNEKLIGTLSSKVLNHSVAGSQLAQSSAHLINRYLLHKFDLYNGSAGKVDAESGTFNKKSDQDHYINDC